MRRPCSQAQRHQVPILIDSDVSRPKVEIRVIDLRTGNDPGWVRIEKGPVGVRIGAMHQEVLDPNVTRIIADKVVHRDLLHQIKRCENVPSSVCDSLLGRFCASDDENEIRIDIEAVKEILRNDFFRPKSGDCSNSIKPAFVYPPGSRHRADGGRTCARGPRCCLRRSPAAGADIDCGCQQRSKGWELPARNDHDDRNWQAANTCHARSRFKGVAELGVRLPTEHQGPVGACPGASAERLVC